MHDPFSRFPLGFQALDELVKGDKLKKDRADFFKSKYQAMHDALISLMDNDMRLMARAKTLNAQLQVQSRSAGDRSTDVLLPRKYNDRCSAGSEPQEQSNIIVLFACPPRQNFCQTRFDRAELFLPPP